MNKPIIFVCGVAGAVMLAGLAGAAPPAAPVSIGVSALPAAAPSANSKSTAGDRVQRVVVYPDRAQVTRVARVACGDHVLVRFAALPPAADPASLRAQTDRGHIDGLRSEERARDEAFSKKLEELSEQIHQIELAQESLIAQQGRDDSAVQLASRYEQLAQSLISREIVEPGNPRAWSAALDSALQTRLQAAAARSERTAKQRELERKRDELRQQAQRQATAAARKELYAEVLLSCPAALTGQPALVDLSYMIGGAGWVPAHEARLDDSGSSVTLTSFATLSQSSGEDWNGAQITLSTAVPRQNATPPNISPLRVYADPREPPKKVLVSRAEQQEHAEASGSTAKNDEAVSAGKPQRRDQGLSVQFVVALPADIAGDGTKSRLSIAESRLPARLFFRTVPKLMPYVFRVADLTNIGGYPLLPGPLDAFRRGQFLARYELAHVANGARFQLTFGLEDRLKVKRHVIEELARDQGLFGGTRRHRYVYRFEVQNFLDHPDEVELAEHIPISELDDIKIALAPQTSAGYQLNADDGIVTWRLPLRAGEKKILSLAYFVDVPTSYTEP